MILVSLAILICLAALSPVLARYAKPALGPIAALALAGIGVWLIQSSWIPVTHGEAVLSRTAWVPDLGIDLAFRIDGLSLTFGLLISFIGSLVMLYAGAYMKTHARAGEFFATLLVFAASMLGLVLADNLVMVFVFWELTSITSYLLVGFDHHRESARRSAQQALLVTGLGGLVLLAGLIVLGVAAGGFSVSDVLGASVHEHGLYGLAAVLIAVGCFTKSAIFPFHFWLPNAMEAPSPVSALLHSSTMVKAGVYLLARLHPAMGGDALWDNLLIGFGALTMVYAAFLATRQDGLKKILAFTTVSSLGALVMLIGLDAAEAAMAYLIAHAMFKGCLFLVAGSLIKKTGFKDASSMGGLRHAMPVTALAGRLGALSLAGFPPLMGFVAKELMLKAGLDGGAWAIPVTLAIVATAVFFVYAALVLGLGVFHGEKPEGVGEPHDPPLAMSVGPVLLAVGGLLAGLLPGLFAEPLVHAGTANISRAAVEAAAHGSAHGSAGGVAAHGGHSLSGLAMLVHPSLALLLSLGALAGGFALYRSRAAFGALTGSVRAPSWLNADRAFDAALHGVLDAAAWQTRLLQNGSLRWYMRVTLATATALTALALVNAGFPALDPAEVGGSTVIDWLLAGIICAGAIGALFQKRALAAIAVMGTVGFVGAVVFLLYGAPDVAMTQLATETLIVIIFVLVIYHLPQFSMLTSWRSRAVDGVIALSVGAVMTTLTLQAANIVAPGPLISEFHAAQSYEAAHGRNVVNVILVDFRGFDTLGEIFVLGASAVGLFTLLRPPARIREARA